MEQVNFLSALDAMKDGNAATRLEWGELFIFMNRSDSGLIRFDASDGRSDIFLDSESKLANDWIILGDLNSD
jgi:hypothetical protein